jgi:hypothetical protein
LAAGALFDGVSLALISGSLPGGVFGGDRDGGESVKSLGIKLPSPPVQSSVFGPATPQAAGSVPVVQPVPTVIAADA